MFEQLAMSHVCDFLKLLIHEQVVYEISHDDIGVSTTSYLIPLPSPYL